MSSLSVWPPFSESFPEGHLDFLLFWAGVRNPGGDLRWLKRDGKPHKKMIK